MKKSDLKKFAKLIAVQGVNVQKGQPVIIRTSIEAAPLVRYVVEECYKAGAREVSIDWSDDEISRITYNYEDTEVLSTVPNWQVEKVKWSVENLPARIHILASDPDALATIDKKKLMAVRQAVGKVIKPYSDQMENKHQWTIVGYPGVKWAHKVFPDVKSDKKAVELLWEGIYKTTRLEGNPIKNWKEHAKFIHGKCDFLNDLNIKELHYKAGNGTDFTIGLTGKTLFHGGSVATISGVTYDPNMPTEECYTSPDPKTASGKVFASKPLSLYGNVIKDFGFRFENGEVKEIYGDKKAVEILTELTQIDEGAKRLGEVALVSFDSPVNQTGILFFNTLYDENACCHLALGAGFDDCIRDFEKKSEEELKAVGLNDSVIHIDFMIGTRDLEITAKTFDGKTVLIFKNGTWV